MLYIWELDRLKGGESDSIPATFGAAVGLQWDKSYFHKFATGSGLGKVIWESYKNDSGYSENMTIEHHNSSKYLHWCTGLACGNLLFPLHLILRYLALGGASESNDAFNIFHTTKWHPSDGSLCFPRNELMLTEVFAISRLSLTMKRQCIPMSLYTYDLCSVYFKFLHMWSNFRILHICHI